MAAKRCSCPPKSRRESKPKVVEKDPLGLYVVTINGINFWVASDDAEANHLVRVHSLEDHPLGRLSNGWVVIWPEDGAHDVYRALGLPLRHQYPLIDPADNEILAKIEVVLTEYLATARRSKRSCRC